MRYVRYREGGATRLGVQLDAGIAALSAVLPGAPESMRELVAAGAPLQQRIAEAVAGNVPLTPLDQCELTVPLPDPGKIVCLGLNYADHAKEGGHAVPDYPSLFMRVPTSLTGPGEPMVLPPCSEQFDYEAELVIVVGRRAHRLEEAKAADAVFGYTILNDGSIRDYQRRTAQWTAGKNFDRTGALGPAIVTADELPAEARGLGIRTRLNGEIMQESNTDEMIFGVNRTLAILSEIMTLEPGDLIAMGTPSGVGHARRPPVWMRAGDRVAVEIDRIGTLENEIVAEADVSARRTAGEAARA